MSSLIQGRKVVTTVGTAVQLVADASNVSIKELAVTAETDNTGVITVGNSSVIGALATRQGLPLAAGQTVSLPVDDLKDIWLDTTVNGDGVTYLAVIA